MSPQVIAAVIAAGVGVVTVIATVAVQISGRRATNRDTQRALDEQRKQLDRTLAEQRTRTLNERFATAAGQLGSDKSAVRLAGMYAMAGLADDWPENRQTCVDVLCAYLRMPFSATPPVSKPELEATEDPGEPDVGTSTVAFGDTWPQERDAWQQEKQVRLMAQRILAEHLRDDRAKDWHPADPPSPRFWPNIHLDLAGATLIDLNLRRCVMAAVNFSEATFSGVTLFVRATFDGTAEFGRATFEDTALFDDATFKDLAVFTRSKFRGAGGFHGVTFGSEALFGLVTLGGMGAFGGATFSGRALFDGATFNDAALFARATIRHRANFSRATFNDVAEFTEATFDSDAVFGKASFNGVANFEGATFKDGEGSLNFERSRVLFFGAGHVWPPGWRLESDGSDGGTVVRANDNIAPVTRQVEDEQTGGDNDGGPG